MTRPNDVGVGTAVLITRKIMRSTGRFGNVWHPQVLLGKRRGAHGAGLWSLPGGWIDRSDATLEEAAARARIKLDGHVKALSLKFESGLKSDSRLANAVAQ